MFLKHPINDYGAFRTLECEGVSYVTVKGSEYLKDTRDFKWLFAQTAAEGWEIPMNPEKHPIVAEERYTVIGVTLQAEQKGYVLLLPAGCSYLLNDHGSTVERI